MKIIGLACLILLTWCVRVLHLGVFPPPMNHKPEVAATSVFYPKERDGIQHITLFGNAYQRGYEFGRQTQGLIYTQEKHLYDIFETFVPNPLWQKLILIGLMRVFWGIEHYFDSSSLDEIYGVSQFSSSDFNHLADPFTRQVALHGLHEIGQMFVDSSQAMHFGCSAFGIRFEDSWSIARNFDFTGGKIFDREKIIKWSFPDNANAYLSVIWAGMVGVVTGINEKGLYLSLNAAGSDDFSRYGLPSTLLIKNVLEQASSANEALQIIKQTPMFITDIFLLLDSQNQRAYRIEKSPHKTFVTELKQNFVITNHLNPEAWTEDQTNQRRIQQQTTLQRFQRGNELLKALKAQPIHNREQLNLRLLSFLRDKPFYAGHAQNIDALIATHSIIYDSLEQKLYVSQGPALVGAFQGYDLKSSFQKRRPIPIEELPADPQFSIQQYQEYENQKSLLKQFNQSLKDKNCQTAKHYLARLSKHPSVEKLTSQGVYEHLCEKRPEASRKSWESALKLKPAYQAQRDQLKKLLECL